MVDNYPSEVYQLPAMVDNNPCEVYQLPVMVDNNPQSLPITCYGR